MNCDEDTAIEYLDESKSVEVYDQDTAEASWDMQVLTARCAQSLGFDGVCVSDEHGKSWMIDMKKNISLLQGNLK